MCLEAGQEWPVGFCLFVLETNNVNCYAHILFSHHVTKPTFAEIFRIE